MVRPPNTDDMESPYADNPTYDVSGVARPHKEEEGEFSNPQSKSPDGDEMVLVYDGSVTYSQVDKSFRANGQKGNEKSDYKLDDNVKADNGADSAIGSEASGKPEHKKMLSSVDSAIGTDTSTKDETE